jgi:hypothetical protein
VIGQGVGDEEQPVLEAKGAACGDLLHQEMARILLGWENAWVLPR